MKVYLHISFYFIIWLLLILFISYFGFLRLPHSGSFDNDFLKSFANWDGGHFLGIAKYGYSEKFQYAFFPLYPIAVKLFTQITKNFFLSGILISVVSSFLGFQILYKLISLEFDKKIAEKVVLLMLIFPTSFYFLTAYSEGLFFFLVVSTFYFLRSKKFLLATIFAILTSTTRLVGLALVLGVLVEVIAIYGLNKKTWMVILAPVGFLIYSIYLYLNLGDPFYFIFAENHWQRSIMVPVMGFWETINNLSKSGFISNNFNSFLDLIFAIFGVGFSIRTFRFLSPSYCVYALVSILLPIFTPTLSSIPRFLLPIFPIFLLLAFIKNKFIIFGYQIFSIMLLSLFTVLFVCGYWVS